MFFKQLLNVSNSSILSLTYNDYKNIQRNKFDYIIINEHEHYLRKIALTYLIRMVDYIHINVFLWGIIINYNNIAKEEGVTQKFEKSSQYKKTLYIILLSQLLFI